MTNLKQSLFAKVSDKLKDVILFGSQLHEDEKQTSDFDILVIVKGISNWRLERDISDICYDIDLKYDILTDVHVLGKDELDTPVGRQPVFIDAFNHGYHITFDKRWGKRCSVRSSLRLLRNIE